MIEKISKKLPGMSSFNYAIENTKEPVHVSLYSTHQGDAYNNYLSMNLLKSLMFHNIYRCICFSHFLHTIYVSPYWNHLGAAYNSCLLMMQHLEILLRNTHNKNLP
jgi:hypothetical protein